MPQITSIVLADREATPVNHTFVLSTSANGVARLVNGVSGVPIGNEVVTISSRKSGSRYKSKAVIALPTVQTQTINGISVPVVVRQEFCEISFTVDETSTTQERKNLVGMAEALVKATQTALMDVFVNLNPPI